MNSKQWLIYRELQNHYYIHCLTLLTHCNYKVKTKYKMPLSVLMAVLFLRELQIQGLVGRTLQYKQLCWTMWKECTSYVNHRKIYLNLGQLWYHMFLIGFRVLECQVLLSPLPSCQLCTGVPMRSPCPLCSCCKQGICGRRSPTLPAPQHTQAAGCLGTACCLHSNSLSALEEEQRVTYGCWIKLANGTNKVAN